MGRVTLKVAEGGAQKFVESAHTKVLAGGVFAVSGTRFRHYLTLPYIHVFLDPSSLRSITTPRFCRLNGPGPLSFPFPSQP
jgi:hypothetical protein